MSHLLHVPRPQAKLTVGAPNDAFEQEADRVADQVMRMPEEEVTAAAAPPLVQRMCAECEEEKKDEGVVMRKCASCEEEEKMQAKEEPGKTPEVPEGLAGRFAALHGGGQALPASERSFFEPRFGHDFASVRLHSGPALQRQPAPAPPPPRVQATATGPPPAARLYVLSSEGPIFGINSGRSGLEQALTFAKIQFSAGFSWLQPPGGRVFFIQNILSTDDTVETCGRCCRFTSGPGVDEEKYYGAGEVLVRGRRQEIKFVKLPTPANPGTFNLFFLRTSDTPTMPVDSVFCGSLGTQFPDGTSLKVDTTQRFRMFAAWEPSEAGPVTPLASVDWGFRTCKTMVKDQTGKTGSDAWTEKADCGTAMLPQQSKSDPPVSELLLDPVLHAADFQQQLEKSCSPCSAS